MVDRIDDLLAGVGRLRDRPLVAAGAAAAVLLVAALVWTVARPSAATPVDELIPRASAPPPAEAGEAVASAAPPTSVDELLVVHVIGEVNRPGLVTVTAGGRVSDAIDRAGGPTSAADIHQLNLAAPLADGMQVRVPARGEEPTGPLIRGGGPSGDRALPGGGAAPGSPLDVNRAGPAELESLPGVGPAIAAAIVAHRDEHGPFASVDDLQAVAGIGPAKLAAIRDLITV